MKPFQAVLSIAHGHGSLRTQGQIPKRRKTNQYFHGREGVATHSRLPPATALQILLDGACSYLIRTTPLWFPLRTDFSYHGVIDCSPTASFSNHRSAMEKSAITSPNMRTGSDGILLAACRAASKAYSRTPRRPGTPRSLRLVVPRASPPLRARPSTDFVMATVRNVDVPVVIVVSVLVLVAVGALVCHSVLYVPSCLAPYVSNVLDSSMYPEVTISYFFVPSRRIY